MFCFQSFMRVQAQEHYRDDLLHLMCKSKDFYQDSTENIQILQTLNHTLYKYNLEKQLQFSSIHILTSFRMENVYID